MEEEERPKYSLDIKDDFPNEYILAASHNLMPWFVDFANFLASDLMSDGLNSHQRKKFIYEARKFYWEEPYLFKVCADGVIRRFVLKVGKMPILEACHFILVGGHHGGMRTTVKVLQSVFYWTMI